MATTTRSDRNGSPLSRPKHERVRAARERCEQIADGLFPDETATFTDVRMWDDRDFEVTVIYTVYASPDDDGRWQEVSYKHSDGTVVYRDYEDSGGERTYHTRRTVETFGTPYAERRSGAATTDGDAPADDGGDAS